MTLKAQRLGCLLALGKTSVEDVVETLKESGAKRGPAKRRNRDGVQKKIVDLLKLETGGLDVKEIVQRLRGVGVSLEGQRPEGTIYTAMHRHRETFERNEAGKWFVKQEGNR